MTRGIFWISICFVSAINLDNYQRSTQPVNFKSLNVKEDTLATWIAFKTVGDDKNARMMASMWLDKTRRTPQTLRSITTPKTLAWTVKNWIQGTILNPTKETFLPTSVKPITIASIKRQPEPFSVRSILPRSASFFGKPFISDQLQPM
jgi:hypothetical protein